MSGKLPDVVEAAGRVQRRSTPAWSESPITAIIWRKPRAVQASIKALEQRAADAAAMHVGRDVDRILDGEAVGRPRAKRAGIGVAGERAVDLGDDVGKPLPARSAMRRVISASSGGSSSNEAVPCSTACA